MKKYITFTIMALAVGLTSCNDFLDKLPDDRAELDTQDKISKFLVSAYVNNLPDFIFEISSDNVLDNGTAYKAQPNQDKIYHWQDVETEGNDDPRSLWNGGYEAAAAANEALAAIGDENIIKRIGGNAEVRAHLQNLGFVTGAAVTVVSSMGGNLIVNIKNTRIAISKEMAQKIYI